MELTGAEERACTEDDLRGATEAFLASTTREVQPVSAIEDIELPVPGERTREAATGLRARIEKELAAGG
jgi:branched-chain amino acid aminotransferase